MADLQRLIQFLIDKFVVRCCLERDGNGRAACLHVDDASLVGAFLNCLHLIGEMDQGERDLTGLLELVGRSQENCSNASDTASSHLSIFKKLLSAYDEKGRTMTEMQDVLGGKFYSTCRFESTSAPSDEPVYPVSSSINVDDKNYFRSRALDLKKLEKHLYPPSGEAERESKGNFVSLVLRD